MVPPKRAVPLPSERQAALGCNMIITHTARENGERRVYLGSAGSIELFVEPVGDKAWRLHAVPSDAGQRLSAEDVRICVAYTLAKLCARLDVAASDLASTTFDTIAALHDADPGAGRRQPLGRRRSAQNGYYATQPNVRAVRTTRHVTDGSKSRGR